MRGTILPWLGAAAAQRNGDPLQAMVMKYLTMDKYDGAGNYSSRPPTVAATSASICGGMANGSTAPFTSSWQELS